MKEGKKSPIANRRPGYPETFKTLRQWNLLGYVPKDFVIGGQSIITRMRYVWLRETSLQSSMLRKRSGKRIKMKCQDDGIKRREIFCGWRRQQKALKLFLVRIRARPSYSM